METNQNSVGTVKGWVYHFDAGKILRRTDQFAREEPLEIAIRHGKADRREISVVAVIMRTPGDDELLALGFCFSEQIIRSSGELLAVRHFDDENRILIELRAEIDFDVKRYSRNIFSTSSCGICGKTSIDHIRTTSHFPILATIPEIAPAQLLRWPTLLGEHQAQFAQTGGMHACLLIDLASGSTYLKEDIGRHNALDKLVGYALKNLSLPLHNFGLMLSGRASFELVQKAAMVGIPIVAAIGAPSSLAIDLADECNQTLIGFLREESFNIYSGMERIVQLPAKA